MKTIFKKIRKYLLLWLPSLLLLPIFWWWLSFAVDDLLWQLMTPAKEHGNIINVWENVKTVWNNVIHGSTEIGWDWVWNPWSIVVRVTRFLLILTIALSVTMILYNGMIYIIETWQWKEGKSLIKNVLLIVVWILVSLFSVVAINLIQSIPETLEKELKTDITHKDDMEVLKGKKMSWKEVWKSIKDIWKSIWHGKDDDKVDAKTVEELQEYCEKMWWKFELTASTESNLTYACKLEDWSKEEITVPKSEEEQPEQPEQQEQS